MDLFEYLDQTIENLTVAKSENIATEMNTAIAIAVDAIQKNKLIIVAGNGGSMSDAQHLSGELVNFFTRKHRAFPVLTLGVNSAVSTAWANDFEFSDQFAREFSAYSKFCGLLLVFTTSGRSENINRLLELAKIENIPSVAFASESAVANFKTPPDILISPNVKNTSRIQEIHVNLMHFFCQEIENIIEER
jgi:D-sedoheptulose 7-phosphate isomerase